MFYISTRNQPPKSASASVEPWDPRLGTVSPNQKKKGPGDGLKSIRLLYFVKKRIGINISNII